MATQYGITLNVYPADVTTLNDDDYYVCMQQNVEGNEAFLQWMVITISDTINMTFTGPALLVYQSPTAIEAGNYIEVGQVGPTIYFECPTAYTFDGYYTQSGTNPTGTHDTRLYNTGSISANLGVAMEADYYQDTRAGYYAPISLQTVMASSYVDHGWSEWCHVYFTNTSSETFLIRSGPTTPYVEVQCQAGVRWTEYWYTIAGGFSTTNNFPEFKKASAGPPLLLSSVPAAPVPISKRTVKASKAISPAKVQTPDLSHPLYQFEVKLSGAVPKKATINTLKGVLPAGSHITIETPSPTTLIVSVTSAADPTPVFSAFLGKTISYTARYLKSPGVVASLGTTVQVLKITPLLTREVLLWNHAVASRGGSSSSSSSTPVVAHTAK